MDWVGGGWISQCAKRVLEKFTHHLFIARMGMVKTILILEVLSDKRRRYSHSMKNLNAVV
jgi:hypothetical protein